MNVFAKASRPRLGWRLHEYRALSRLVTQNTYNLYHILVFSFVVD